MHLRDELGLSGPPVRSWLSGNLQDLLDFGREYGIESRWKFHMVCKEKFGSIYGFYMGPRLKIVVSDLEIAEQIFIRQFNNFTDREVFPIHQSFPMIQSLLANRGKTWKAVRAIVSPTFTSAKLRMMSGTIDSKISCLLERMNEHASNGQSFDIYDHFQRLTLDVIAKIAFAIDSNCQTDREDQFYLDCIKTIQVADIKNSPLNKLCLLFPEFTTIYGLMRPWTAFGKAEKPLIDGLQRVFDERKARFSEFKTPDALQLLLQQDKEFREKTGNRNKKTPLDRKTIIANCFAFLLAGFETTSTALAFTAWLLAKHQHVQQELCEEIDEKFSSETEEINSDSVLKLPYLDAVFHESLRRYPPAIQFTARKCTAETWIKGYRFPKGIEVHLPVQLVHYNSEIWPDPFKFDPKRFTENTSGRHQLSWIPFGVGPRNCIGLKLAEIKYKMTLVHLVQKFKLSFTQESQEPLLIQQNGLFLRPKDGVKLKVEKRNSQFPNRSSS